MHTFIFLQGKENLWSPWMFYGDKINDKHINLSYVPFLGLMLGCGLVATDRGYRFRQSRKLLRAFSWVALSGGYGVSWLWLETIAPAQKPVIYQKSPSESIKSWVWVHMWACFLVKLHSTIQWKLDGVPCCITLGLIREHLLLWSYL